ncbi:MAG: molecular chaperone HtpG, partial [Clostridiales bacterium]|nr:molecular chaperone HtpG [Clostridiales bacterium]
NISINTENIFPIIKKWLYSDKDIFVREIISNASDAINKHKRLVDMGEVVQDDNKYEIHVRVDKKNKTLSFTDNGIGMTGEEVKKYINQIAFSGAQDFLEKYKDKTDGKDDIIGHFGLGFYSAFMVAERVEVDTLSFEEGAEAVIWESDGTSEYTMQTSERTERGSTITLHITKEEKEFLDFWKVSEVTKKYCEFMAIDIYVEDVNKKPDKDEEIKEPTPINDTEPLWLKKPSDCTDEEYEDFYKKAFKDYEKPLFWIHLNMEYPFRLKGILYFPKLKHELESAEGRIKLFYNQVFVADNVKEVIPEFLMLLKGVLDCPDLPLNVSRSFLQNDGYVKKISKHITKKVADKLKKLYKKQRDDYNAYWDDINPFVKYGCLRDEKFYDRIKDFIIYKTINDEYKTADEFLGLSDETVEKNDSNKQEKLYYVSDTVKQAQYMEMFKEHQLDAVILDTMLDSSFISFIESKLPNIKFESIDSNIAEALKGDGESEGFEELMTYFNDVIGEATLKIEVSHLKTAEMPAVIMGNEESKRMRDMSRMFGGMDMGGAFPDSNTLVLNSSNPVIKKMALSKDGESKKIAVRHIYELALLTAGKLDAKALSEFVKRSGSMLEKTVGGDDPGDTGELPDTEETE